jgi:hypothetical protein
MMGKRINLAKELTDSWLDFARDCGHVTTDDHERLAKQCAEVGALIKDTSSFLIA